MYSLNKLPKSLIFLWLIQIAIVGIIWDFLPNSLTGNLLLTLLVVNGVLLFLRQLELPLFATIALLLVLVHFWLGNGYASPLLVSLVIFIGSALIGLIAVGSHGPIGQDDILIWSLVGLFTSQITSLTQFWPISIFQKSMLGTIVFYLVWQSWRVIESDRKPIMWHFIFVGLAVMVVIANIIWTTWPGLNSF
ncbi:MAG: hypothetical protein AAB613_00055 [Patescibacteria group bacterium]